MSFESLLNSEKYILAQGSVFELLRRRPEVVYDENVSNAGLIYDQAQVHGPYTGSDQDNHLKCLAKAEYSA